MVSSLVLQAWFFKLIFPASAFPQSTLLFKARQSNDIAAVVNENRGTVDRKQIEVEPTLPAAMRISSCVGKRFGVPEER
jgi:hypothetical protein